MRINVYKAFCTVKAQQILANMIKRIPCFIAEAIFMKGRVTGKTSTGKMNSQSNYINN